jgi:excisionase family DNA binding protein
MQIPTSNNISWRSSDVIIGFRSRDAVALQKAALDHEAGRSVMHTNPNLDNLKTQGELAEYLKVKPRTLQQWRSDGKGPRWTRVGRVIRYRDSDVKEWLDQQEQQKAS